jgi:predicted ATPase/class 3 adenylate cyclase
VRKSLVQQNLPSGTVTFLFTDIEGSTKLWEQYPEEARAALIRHDTIIEEMVGTNDGAVVRPRGEGDSRFAVFARATDALSAAAALQKALYSESWPTPTPLKIRIALHTGEADLREGDYYGSAVNRCARLRSAAHGGQTLVSYATYNLVCDTRSAGVEFRDLGEHRLKDLERPEHVFQVVIADLPSDFPPLKTLDTRPNNLPRQLTPFIGREMELTLLKNLLSDVRNRLVTIVAPGGMGKTRLSLEAAEQIYQEEPLGVCFVALDRLNSADFIAQAVAEALPISLATQEDPKSRIISYLRDNPTLLVMDNFEHVLDGATFVQELLEAAPRAQVLATSRVKLNLMGETLFHIEGLAVDEANLEKNSAIQLFAQSARRTQPGFELNAAVLPAVTRICRMVDGMPLAIVLAAAWSDTLSVDEIAAEIEKSIDILETERRDVPDRQRSVRAVIESSWNQVDASAQGLLQRLTVFRGGFTRAAAEEAAQATLRALSQLVDKALLRRDPDTGRYSMHELVRQYAEEQLARSAEAERSAHEAHASYFADFMKTRETHLHDQRERAALLEIEADFDNIRVAWTYWTDKQDAGRITGFVSALWHFFEVRGSFAPAIQFFNEAAQRLTANEPDIICARAQLRARQAWFTALIGLPDEGLRLAQESIDTLRRYDPQGISLETLHCLNINAIFMNKLEMVAEMSREMMERAQRSGDAWERGFALIWLGYALVFEHRIDEAQQSGEEALAIFESLGNPFGASVASAIILASTAIAIGDTGAAKLHFLRGMQAAEEINYLRLMQRAYDGLGTSALMEHDVQQARQFFLKSLRISQECGQTREMLAALLDLASVHIAQGKLGDALQLLAVVIAHPASEQNSLNHPEPLRDEAEKLRTQIETQLDQTSYRSAWEAGGRQSLAQVVAQILD